MKKLMLISIVFISFVFSHREPMTVYDYLEQMYAPGLSFDSAEAYINPDATDEERKRQHDVAEISANEQAQKLGNLYNTTDNNLTIKGK